VLGLSSDARACLFDPDGGVVVGVDRLGQADALRAHGADLVVGDLSELLHSP